MNINIPFPLNLDWNSSVTNILLALQALSIFHSSHRHSVESCLEHVCWRRSFSSSPGQSLQSLWWRASQLVLHVYTIDLIRAEQLHMAHSNVWVDQFPFLLVLFLLALLSNYSTWLSLTQNHVVKHLTYFPCLYWNWNNSQIQLFVRFGRFSIRIWHYTYCSNERYL